MAERAIDPFLNFTEGRMSTIYINSYTHGGVTYLLRDDFTTDDAAPMTSPRTCEAGPGTITFVQTDGQQAISSSALQITAQTTPNFGDQGWYGLAAGGGGFTRQAGLAMLLTFNVASLTIARIHGLRTDAAIGLGNENPAWYFRTTSDWRIRISAADVILGLGSWSTATNYQTAIVLMSSGSVMLIKGGAFTEWTVVFVTTTDTGSTVYPFASYYQQTGVDDSLKMVRLGGDWNTDYGITDVHATPGVSGTDYTGQADAIIDLAVTAPASLAGEAGYWFRKQDASNGYRAYFNNAGAFLVDRHVAGTPTNVVSVAGVITGSGTRTIRTIADGTSLRFYTLSGTTWTQRGGTITDSSFSAQTTITPTADASWTGGGGSIGQLDAWPRTLSGAALAALEAV